MTEADKLRLDHEARIYASREARKLAALDPRDVQEDAICTMLMIFHKNLAKVTAERDAMMAALRETEPVMALVRRINGVVLRSNGVGKSECTVDIECADYEDALDLFDLIEELAAHSAATKPEAK